MRDAFGRYVKGHKHPKEVLDKMLKNNPCLRKGWHHSDEVKRLMSINRTGEGNHMYGKHFNHTEEAKRKISESGKGENNWNWQGGKQYEPYSHNWTDQLRDRVRVRDNFMCQVCNIPELECRKRLHVHHKDFNKKNCNMSNLISLCSRCHGKANLGRTRGSYKKKGIMK